MFNNLYIKKIKNLYTKFIYKKYIKNLYIKKYR